MRNDEIKPDVVTYNTLLNKVHTLDEGRAIVADMRNDEIKPDVFTYNTLLNKVHTLDEGRAIIADMRNDGITPNGYPLLARSRTSCCIYGFLKAITWVENYCIALKQSLVTCSSRHIAEYRLPSKRTFNN
jgi:Pentatricopeptide repeat domain